MKKFIIFLLICCTCSLMAADQEFIITEKNYKATSAIPKPEISRPKDIPGGYEFRIMTTDTDADIYWGIVSDDDFWDGLANFINTGDGEKFNSSILGPHVETDSNNIVATIKEPGEYRIYAFAVKGTKTSPFANLLFELSPIHAGNVNNIRFADGQIRGISSYWDVYLSKNSDMSDAVQIEEGPIPSGFSGTAFVQLRNQDGAADSDIVQVNIPVPEVPAPEFHFRNTFGGKEIKINVRQIGNRMGYSSNNEPKIPEGVTVYYTLDGSEPVEGESEIYDSAIKLDKAGNYIIKAIATYGGGISPIAETAVKIEQLPVPEIYVSGCDIMVSGSPDGTLYMGTDPNSINKALANPDCIIIGDEDIGSSIYINVRGVGYANSEHVEFQVDSIESFQNTYSSDKTRQFGNWIVSEQISKKTGVSTGEYILCARWPINNQRQYIIAVADVIDGKIATLAFSNKSDANLRDANWLYSTPVSLNYKLGEHEAKSINSEVFSINYNSLKAQHVITISDNDDVEFFNSLNGAEPFSLNCLLQDELSGLDALEILYTAGTSYSANQDAIVYQMIEDKNLQANLITIDNIGLKEAMAYYLSCSAQ